MFRLYDMMIESVIYTPFEVMHIVSAYFERSFQFVV